MSQTLNRAEHGRPAAPVRIIHLGIGNFTRAHQAWYTDAAPDAAGAAAALSSATGVLRSLVGAGTGIRGDQLVDDLPRRPHRDVDIAASQRVGRLGGSVVEHDRVDHA